MDKIVIDKYSCVRCGQCSASCPSFLIRQETHNDYPSVIPKAEDFCISCNHCVAVCPVGAVTVGNVTSEMCEPVIKESFPRFDHIATLARMRRSIRRYADKPLDDRVIAQMLDVVRWAPTAKNGLPVKWLVVNSREKILELTELVLDWLQTQPGGEGLKSAWDRGIDPIFRGAPCLVAAYTRKDAMWPDVDTTIAVETLDLCVTAMRLGSCWAGYFVRTAQNDPKINQWFELDTDCTIRGGLMIGHIGDEVYQKMPYRPELDIHWVR